ncbi:hypothetical protein Bp8pS_314 [Bacillus phage vB_BpuM-BpSp]|nr:hypothetical protein Bp8pS_314 [Bacillus phage vB_BpuM-BpSp]
MLIIDNNKVVSMEVVKDDSLKKEINYLISVAGNDFSYSVYLMDTLDDVLVDGINLDEIEYIESATENYYKLLIYSQDLNHYKFYMIKKDLFNYDQIKKFKGRYN